MQVPIYAAYLYDAVNVYARALEEALEKGVNPRNGSAIVERIRGRTYDSTCRHVFFVSLPSYIRSPNNCCTKDSIHRQ